MTNKLKYYLRSGILYFGIPFLLWNCEKGNIEPIEEQQRIIETVAINEVVDFFNVKTSSDPDKSANKTYAIPHLNHISQEEIINSDALLTVIPATTVYEGHYSRILLLKIDNEIQSLVFSMYASDATQEYFTGEILITNLQGDFLNGYRVVNGQFIAQFRRKEENGNTAAKTGNTVCPQHGECTEGSTCVLCLQELEEVVVTGGSGGSGEVIDIYVGLNDFPGMEEGGAEGPNMGLEWDYGPGEGGGGMPIEIEVYNPDNPINDVQDFLDCFDPTQSATLTIYVNEPNPGSGNTHSGTFVGHAFVSVSQGNNISVYGFYPVSNWIVPGVNNSSNSVLGDDGIGNEPYSASISTIISGNQLQQIINFSVNYNPNYHLNTYNCTDFAIDIGNLGGLNLPEANGTWPGGGGSNPGTLGLHIRNVNANGVTTNTTAGNAPSTHKGC